jgi:predicted Rossmann fold flavoprotein
VENSQLPVQKYDLIVVGGGPAGMFAAGFAAQNGARVLLLEKNRRCGAKVLITGKGRCNVTNSETDPLRFVEPFGRHGKALLTALYAFSVEDTIDFFEQRGLKLQTERGGRVFPAKGGATDVQKLLQRFVQDSGVELLCDCRVKQLQLDADRITAVETDRGTFVASQYLLATGGLSYPETGCTGDGYGWAKKSGHKLVEPQAALMPLTLAEDWTGEWCELNLKNVKVTAKRNGKMLAERFGEAFFTRNGIGGPIILDMSREVRDGQKKGPVSLHLDLKPAVTAELFDKRLQRELTELNNKDFRNALGKLLPKTMIPRFIELSGIDPYKKCHSISKGERKKLLDLFKDLTVRVTGHEGLKKAIITSGGVSLKDIDMRSMHSKKITNLYFAGEMIDLDGPTGGFNLQVCWSTGYLAGVSAASDLSA